jgi:hypothetical protein
MVIKKSRNIKFFLGVLFIFSLSLVFTIDQQKIITEKDDMVQYIMASNVGLSALINLVDAGNGLFPTTTERDYDEYRKLLFPLIIKAIPKIVKYKLTGDNFKKVFIDIKYLDYQDIMKDRDRALKTGLLSNPTTVKAKIRFQNKTFRAKLRLKGDFSTHWMSKYRMSFRVSLKGKDTILGNSKFSLQKPSAREFPYDDVFQSMIRDTGNLSAIHNYVHVYVNGTDWGIMDMEEHMSKEFLEKQQRKESAIIRFSNEKLWLYEAEAKNAYDWYRVSDPSLNLHLYGGKKYLKESQYRKIYSYVLKHRLQSSPFLYDVDSFSKVFILATMWNDWHVLANSNSRYYFNPYTLKLEPITTDEGSYGMLNDPKNIRFHSLPSQYLSIMSTQSYADNLSYNLDVVSNIAINAKYYFNNKGEIFPVDRKKSGKIVVDNMNKVVSNQNKYLAYSEEDSKEKFVLPTRSQASEFKEHLHVRHYTDGTIELHNLLPDKVVVKSIFFNGKSIINQEIIVPSYLSDLKPTLLITPYIGIQDGRITVESEYQGFTRKSSNDITLISGEIKNPLLSSTAHEFDFINKLDGKKYEIQSGSWIVNKPIVVAGDLHISPGANLKFSKDSYIIVKGSLIAKGKKDSLITFKAISDSWKGIYVLNSNNKSQLRNVDISNVSALEDGLLRLTGGVTFYKADVDFEDVRITNVKAEDAINIVESLFSLNSVRIDHAISDGLDADFSQGTVDQSLFLNIGGDALDFSGSDVDIRNISAINIQDKAISGGEKSIIDIFDSRFDDVGVGIASKDGSIVSVANTSVLDYKLHAAMSYVKKDFYGSPSISMTNCLVTDGDAYIRQKGTIMTVDNIDIPESNLNVKKLYGAGVMKK